MVRNIQEIKNPGGSNHFEQLVSKVSWSTVGAQVLVHDAADSLCNRLTLIFNGCVYCLLSSRVYHENMFFKKEISTTHHASAWGLV